MITVYQFTKMLSTTCKITIVFDDLQLMCVKKLIFNSNFYSGCGAGKAVAMLLLTAAEPPSTGHAAAVL